MHVIIISCPCLDSVRRNPLTGRATDAAIQQAVAKWLQFARDRNGGREERQRQKTQCISNIDGAAPAATQPAVAVILRRSQDSDTDTEDHFCIVAFS
jgi:hypothetical protein